MSTLPNNILRRMAKEDRLALGKGGMTAEEALKRFEARSEKEVQGQIDSWLRLKGIWFARSRMDKRTTGRRGTPDFLFVARPESFNGLPVPMAIEVKYTDGKPTWEQEATRIQMEQNGWRFRYVTSLADVINAIADL